MDEPIELPIDGVLDLHTFKPREVKDLIPDYLAECQERGILQAKAPASCADSFIRFCKSSPR